MSHEGSETLLALVQRMFRSAADRDVSQDAGENPAGADPRLADRQLQWKDRAIAAKALNLTADSDDLAGAGPQVGPDVAIMLAAVRFGHQLANIRTDQLVGGTPEHPDRRRIYRLNGP